MKYIRFQSDFGGGGGRGSFGAQVKYPARYPIHDVCEMMLQKLTKHPCTTKWIAYFLISQSSLSLSLLCERNM